MATDSWNSIADWYAEHVRRGSALHDFACSCLLDCLPDDLRGVRVVDVGCGEGIVTRALAKRGAHVVGVDPVPRLITHARAAEVTDPTGAAYSVDDGCTLATVDDSSVDWVTAGLSLNNVPDLPAALAAVRRVLVRDGRLAFTVPHPCFEAPHSTWTEDPAGRARRVVGDYLDEGFWRSSNPHGVRRAGNHHHTLSTYVGSLSRQGFVIETMSEPTPGAAVTAQQPRRAGLPPFLVVRARRARS